MVCGTMRKLSLTLVLLGFGLIASAHAADKAWYGFRVKVDTAGFALNPTVRSAVIQKVAPDSPAAAQRIEAGDEIIEAEGKTVPGGRALQLKPILGKKIGETLRLRLRRPNGETYPALVTGIRKPAA